MDEEIINRVWQLAHAVPNYDPDVWRKDFAGAWINREQYGLHSNFGWEIDHKYPRSLGGGNEISNLMPIHWHNNITKGNDYPRFKTSVSSDGNYNIRKEQNWKL